MIEEKISLKFINANHSIETFNWPLENVHYVEQLVHEVLDSKGVGPVYRYLFGLKSIEHQVWVAPNLTIKQLLIATSNDTTYNKSKSRSNNAPAFEVRFRFRPASYMRISQVDQLAFDLIFAQVRYDFTHTKFNNEKRDLVLLNGAVLGLISTDLKRYALEHGISVSNLNNRVSLRDFAPKRTIGWQKLLFPLLADSNKLHRILETSFGDYSHDLNWLKRKYIELFLSDLARDYGCEKFIVTRKGTLDGSSRVTELGIRYNQTQDGETCCLIECRPLEGGGDGDDDKCELICDIETISQVTLRDQEVQVNSGENEPRRFRFMTAREAESFVSCVDGYFRLMRKWNFNLCREMLSPELRLLDSIRCHGPIGYEASRQKLLLDQRRGTFLIRKCAVTNNLFLIDTNLGCDSILTIDVVYDPTRRHYKVSKHETSKKMNVELSNGLAEYDSLKSLVSNTHIWIQEGDKNYPHPLSNWLGPGSYDFYPNLLLSLSKFKLADLIVQERNQSLSRSQKNLPNLIPTQLIKMTGKEMPRAYNSHVVKLAILKDGTQVAIKSQVEDEDSLPPDVRANRVAFYNCPGSSINDNLISLSPHLMWRANWPFVENQFIAETIGFDASSISLIQEHFPLGPLDKFLQQNSRLSSVFKLSIAYQLAQALLYLREKQIIHGKIRCHNIFLKQINPMHIKLADPLGPFDAHKEFAFIPLEYEGIRGHHFKKVYDCNIDVWAFGTTLWQIYSKGVMPKPGQRGSELTKPHDCPEEIWNIIELCFLARAERASPQVLFRNLNCAFAWEKGAHGYFYIEQQSDDDEHVHEHADPFESNLGSSLTVVTGTRRIAQTSDESWARGPSPGSSTHSSVRANSGSLTSLIRGAPESTFGGGKISSSNYKRTSRPWRIMANLRSRAPTFGLGISVRGHGIANLKAKLGANGNGVNLVSSGVSTSTSSTPSGSDLTELTELPAHSQSCTVKELNRTWLLESSRLKLGPEIGRGASGVVIKGYLSQGGEGQGDERVVAVKCIAKENLNYSMSGVGDLRREFDILKRLRHKNIVEVLGYVDHQDSSLMLVFEYMALGSLLSCIKDSQHDDIHSLPLAKYARDIAEGMEYLEAEKIVHRDLALRNILAKSLHEVKICDFGLAQSLGSDGHYKLKTVRALPLKWYAPETLNNWTFTHKSDVWSYGVVLWEIYSGASSPQYPGTYANLAETLRHERLARPHGCPEEMYRLMTDSCWAYEPQDRDSFTEISAKLSELIQGDIGDQVMSANNEVDQEDIEEIDFLT